MKNPQNILITGASSGLGAALALHYARKDVHLHMQGRNEQRLAATADACRKKGARVSTQCIDVSDAQGMKDWMLHADADGAIDLVIANAGISAGGGLHGETVDQVRRIFATNIDGTINTIQPLISAMIKRKRGQIAIMSSLAGIRGLPSCPAYSASKACVRFYAEGLRGWLAAHGIEVSAICPGYIRTPMTHNNPFIMPFIMDADKAAHIIARGLARNTSRIVFPKALYLPLWLLSLLPMVITDAFFARLPAKPDIEV